MSIQEKFKFYAATYLVLAKDNQILLLRRFNTGYQDGNYSLVAGHLDGGETAKECMIREAREEVGIDLNPEDLEVVHVLHHISTDREYFDIYIRASHWAGEVTNMEPEKCDELMWCDLNALPDNILPDIKQVLEDIKKGVHYGEFGF